MNETNIVSPRIQTVSFSENSSNRGSRKQNQMSGLHRVTIGIPSPVVPSPRNTRPSPSS
jgi:hypothetical protein